jgi:hypothetical protein
LAKESGYLGEKGSCACEVEREVVFASAKESCHRAMLTALGQ